MLSTRAGFRAIGLLGLLLWPAVRMAAGAAIEAADSSAKAKKPAVAKAKAAGKMPAAKSGASLKTRAGGTVHRTGARIGAGASAARHRVAVKPTVRSIKLTSAFLASAQLRPMAQQLAATRSAAAYAGVLSYCLLYTSGGLAGEVGGEGDGAGGDVEPLG